MSDDNDTPPASEDPTVQNFLDQRWRSAMASVRQAREDLRDIYPELTHHLPETATNKIGQALEDLTASSRKLTTAGPLIIGQEAYDDYVEHQTQRIIPR